TFVEAGGLLAYGVNVPANFRRAAALVDKILKGAKPADLPIESPARIELFVNLKTAKALGLTIPPAVPAPAGEILRCRADAHFLLERLHSSRHRVLRGRSRPPSPRGSASWRQGHAPSISTLPTPSAQDCADWDTSKGGTSASRSAGPTGGPSVSPISLRICSN